MSSPVHQDKDLDVELMYAPPWAREQAREQAREPAAEQASEQQAGAPAAEPPPEPARPSLMPRQPVNLDWPPPGRRLGTIERRREQRDDPYAVDVAVLQLKRQLTLDPDMVPQPPIVYATERRPHLALRIAAVVAVAGLIALGVTLASLPAMKRTAGEVVTAGLSGVPITIDRKKTDRLPPPGAPPRLVTEDRRGTSNEPLPSGVRLDGDAAGATVTFAGLAPDTRLTAGSPAGTGGWRVAAHELGGLKVQAPPGFVGTMEVTVDLRLPGNRIADSQVVRLEWAEQKRASTAPAPAPTPAPVAAAAAPAEARTLHLGADEMATMVQRGEDFLRNGDLAAARLLLRRAAEAGSAGAAFALGATYDPHVVDRIGAVGAMADAAQARSWYQKALDLGAPAASQRLEQLAQTAR
jgi:hypothetical protein